MGDEFRANTYTTNAQVFSSVTALNDGGFVVTWSSDGQDGSGYGIYGQRYAADGTPVGSEFRVNQITAGNQFAETFYGSETVATLADGHLVQVWAGNGPEEVFFRLIDVPSANTAPTLAVANALTSLAEGSYANHVKVADITITDDGAGTNNLTLSGNDAALFEIVGKELFLRAGTVLDFEGGNTTLDVIVQVDDAAVPGSPDDSETLSISVTDVAENGAPILALESAVLSLSEGTYASRVKVADITITDDVAGTNNLTLSGDDAALFEVFDGDLYLKAGTVLDFEGGNPTLDVTVEVDDPAVAGSPDDTEALVVTVQDVAGETINGTSRADTLTGTIEADVINGLAGNDNLQGLGGNDTLDGGSGRDTMAGGTGNDIYVVDGSTDVVSEKANEGVDTVQSSVSYTIGANVENLALTGTQKIDGTGNAASNTITGNGANNTLGGLAGSDTLDGGAGNDVLKGGADADNLTGGAGADKFSLSAVTDSTSLNSDHVQDFVHGTDIIDLSAIDANFSKKGDQAFGFSGSNNQALPTALHGLKAAGIRSSKVT